MVLPHAGRKATALQVSVQYAKSAFCYRILGKANDRSRKFIRSEALQGRRRRSGIEGPEIQMRCCKDKDLPDVTFAKE